MGNINRVVISGRLTRDAELRQAGATWALGFSLAVNERRKDQRTGQWEDCANYVDCVLFGARAEALSRILAKGMQVCVAGRLRWSQWERDGQRRSKLEVVADEVELPARPAGATAAEGSPEAVAAALAAQGVAVAGYDDDIPF